MWMRKNSISIKLNFASWTQASSIFCVLPQMWLESANIAWFFTASMTFQRCLTKLSNDIRIQFAYLTIDMNPLHQFYNKKDFVLNLSIGYCNTVAYHDAEWIILYWMSSNVFAFEELTNQNPLIWHANATAAYLAPHDNQFWIHFDFGPLLWSLSMPWRTSRSISPNGPLITANNL